MDAAARKGFQYGQSSSHNWSFFLVKDPATPRRIYLSACFSTFPSAPTTPSESGVYSMYNLFRIATKPGYSESFLEELREGLQDHFIAVDSRNIDDLGGKPDIHAVSQSGTGDRWFSVPRPARDQGRGSPSQSFPKSLHRVVELGRGLGPATSKDPEGWRHDASAGRER
ncbi:hypothetical protein B0H14DRAFT_1012775 [Mycena olivaceomarginata]|nr:hypothetical protein B0H14DRAFT_1012775 [Mycena olivaceomarginata]